MRTMNPIRKRFAILLVVWIVFSLVPVVYAPFRVHFPPGTTMDVEDGFRYHYGDDYIQSNGTDATITAWFVDNWVNYTTVSSGTQTIYNGTEPANVYIDGVLTPKGSGWTYSDGKIMLTTVTSSADIQYGASDQPPNVLKIGHNTTTASSPCLFYLEVEDDIGLSHSIFGTNVTGSWVNETYALSGTTDWNNVTKTLPASDGVRIDYQFWVNDSSNQWTTQEPYFLTTASGHPTYSGISHTETLVNSTCVFSCYWMDDVALSHSIFSTNNSGSWVNATPTSLSGTGDWDNKTKTLTSTVGASVRYMWFANDSGDQWSTTAIYFLVTTSPPSFNYTQASDPITWYMRSDTQTIYTTTGYKLDTTQTTSEQSVLEHYPYPSWTVFWGWRVWLLKSDDTMEELTSGDPVAVVNRSTVSEGYQTSYWNPSRKRLHIGYSSFRLILYMRIGSQSWTAKATFVSNQLTYKWLEPTSWTFILYTKRQLTYICRAHWGSSSFNSRIENIEFTDSNVFEKMAYRMSSANLVGFVTLPYTYLIGNLAYGLVMLIICVPLYIRHKNFTAILILFILFGGGTGFATMLVPVVALPLAWAFMVIGLAGLFWRVFR